MTEKTAQKEPGKKPVPSKKPKPQQEVVVQIPLSELHPFPDHPFQVREDASMQETAESVKEYGVLVPALARPREDGGYELIAGHRRKHACELAGLATMPVIVRDIDRDAATIIMVDSNLQRENILPSERAKAYKMKMEAIKRQGARTDLTSPKISAKFRSDDEVGQDAGVSGDTIRNYIALTQIVPELRQMEDEKKIALSPAYQLAALTPKEQGLLLETIDSEQTTPSLSQAQRMKKLSQSGELNEDTMLSIMMEQKKPEKNDITLSGEKLRKYFPRSYTPFQIENTIFKLLDAWLKKPQRDQSRRADKQFVCPLFSCQKEDAMYINTFKYTPKDVSCQLCTEYVKKLGCTALRCPWLAERIEAGVVGYREAVLETFPHERRLFQRLNLLIKHYPGSLWSNAQHERRMQYQCAVQGYRRRRDTNAYYAAMYLLTSNDDIYRRTANCFCKDGIEFGYAVLKNTSPHNYALFMAARDLCDKTEAVTMADLAEPEVIDPEALRLIVNATLIARYGLAAFQIRARGAEYER